MNLELKFLLYINFNYFGFALYAAVVVCVALILVARNATAGSGYRPSIR